MKYFFHPNSLKDTLEIAYTEEVTYFLTSRLELV